VTAGSANSARARNRIGQAVGRFLASVVIGCLVCLGAPLCLATKAAADPVRKVEFVITDPRITESSGLASDPSNRVYWTFNDSDKKGVLYALNRSGRTVGTLRYSATPTDVESIAYRDGRLYVGDTGGNRQERTSVTVYEFKEARPDNSEQPFRELTFSYPDGAHDTEAMMVAPDGRLLFVTKGPEGGIIFAAPANPTEASPNQLSRVGDAPQYVTDATYLTDGRPVLRSYVGVFVLDPTTFEVVARDATPGLKQGESVTKPLTGSGLLIGTEGEKSEVLRVPVPVAVGRMPTITPSPATPSPIPTASASPPPDQQSSGLGINLPLVIGAGAAIAAGTITLVVVARRPRQSP